MNNDSRSEIEEKVSRGQEEQQQVATVGTQIPLPSLEGSSPRDLSTTALIKEIGADVTHLARTQVALALTELRADLKNEAQAVAGLGFAALSGVATAIMLLVTATLALAQWMPAWMAGLLVSGMTLAVALIAALVSWNKRVRSPLARTRRTIEEDVQWSKERLA
jgi:Putative Actinobacterial Holin-X, holin superfamily III